LISEPKANRWGEQPLLARIPQREGEHAAQVFEQRVAVAFVEADDHLAVAVRDEAVPVGLEPRPQLHIVVDLAVADEPDRLLDVVQRLAAARQIDDRETPVTQRRLAVAEHTLAVRATVDQGAEHGADVLARRIKRPDNAGDAAHHLPPARCMIASRNTAS
jgi:hypothetical protein